MLFTFSDIYPIIVVVAITGIVRDATAINEVKINMAMVTPVDGAIVEIIYHIYYLSTLIWELGYRWL